MTRTVISAAVLSVAFLVSLAGCGGSSSAHDSFNDGQGYVREYRDALAELDLPPGVKPPQTPPGNLNEQFQTGMGVTAADRVWLCSWIDRWIDTRSQQPAQADAALSRLATFPKTHFYDVLDEVGRQNIADAQRAAKLGDSQKYQYYAKVNCA